MGGGCWGEDTTVSFELAFSLIRNKLLSFDFSFDNNFAVSDRFLPVSICP